MSRRRQLKVRPLCPTPSKVVFTDEVEADAALHAIWRKQITGLPVPERAYKCPCGQWHLTKVPQHTPRDSAPVSA